MHPIPEILEIGKVIIYGLFEGGICYYVGQTVHPKIRRTFHARHTMKGRAFEMFVLEITDVLSANECERRLLKDYQRRGEAMLNKSTPPMGPKRFPVHGSQQSKLQAILNRPQICRFATFIAAPLALASNYTQPVTPTSKDPLLTLDEAAKELRISFRSLKQIIKDGGLKPDKTLGRIRLSAVRAYAK